MEKENQNSDKEGESNHSDMRESWDWETKYSGARLKITCEAFILFFYLLVASVLMVCIFARLGLLQCPKSLIPIGYEIASIFIAGVMGATIFSLKWLIHSVSKGSWHIDRIFWRILVPIMGGFYACVILIVLNSNVVEIGFNQSISHSQYIYRLAGAFLVGFVADFIGGLLTNIAKSTFGLTGQ